jgi:hypothetical protein
MNRTEKILQNSGYVISTYLFPSVDTKALNNRIIEFTDHKGEVAVLIWTHAS